MMCLPPRVPGQTVCSTCLERVQRRTAEQIVDWLPVVPLLHTFAPQMVDQLEEVLKIVDNHVPE